MRDANDYSKANLLVELTSNIVVAYLGNHIVPITDVAHLISNVHSTLSDVSRHMQVVETIEKQKPAVAVRKSVQSNHITCLECGENFKSLKRHLTTFHSLSPDEYREKWELPAEYPMVAPTYAEARSQLAKEMGLGQRRSRS